jgi:hypothetical protein
MKTKRTAESAFFGLRALSVLRPIADTSERPYSVLGRCGSGRFGFLRLKILWSLDVGI